jgi:hypothetical protein
MKAATMSAAGIPKPEEPGDMDVAGLFFSAAELTGR